MRSLVPLWKTWLAVLIAGQSIWCLGDAFIIAPSIHGRGPNETGTLYPFLIKWTAQSPTAFFTMRYQQVYNSSLFTNLEASLIYVTTLEFSFYASNYPYGSQVPSMQINLSTTQKSADGLSPVFSENVGSDDTLVFGPSNYSFDFNSTWIQFTRPFRYNPTGGNLLLDVRIFNGADPLLPTYAPLIDAFNSSTDEVSRVWATNVTATTATGGDTIGFATLFQLTPIPSLRAEFDPHLCDGCPTNLVLIRWPPQPTNFIIQTTDRLVPNTLWRAVTNQVQGDPDPQRGGWSIETEADSAGPKGFYRLVWPNGY